MKPVLHLPEAGDAAFLANLVDRPFIQHIVEFLAEQGLRKLLIVGSDWERANSLLKDGSRWDIAIEYRQSLAPSDYEAAIPADHEKYLFASAASLPRFALRQQLESGKGAMIYGPDGNQWTGWAVVEAREVAALADSSRDPMALYSYLRTVRGYPAISADVESRCAYAEELWQAHQDALKSNLTDILHGGLEVRPGVWIARNASVDSHAEITAPVFIGENARILAHAKVGPFAVVAKDCLIAPNTVVRHAVVAPGTYAGNNLELDHVLVDKRDLFDFRFGVAVEHVDTRILDDVFDFHWAAIPHQLVTVLRAAIPEALSSRLPSWRESWREAKPPASARTAEIAKGGTLVPPASEVVRARAKSTS